jgi:hypothetical protein
MSIGITAIYIYIYIYIYYVHPYPERNTQQARSQEYRGLAASLSVRAARHLRETEKELSLLFFLDFPFSFS